MKKRRKCQYLERLWKKTNLYSLVLTWYSYLNQLIMSLYLSDKIKFLYIY